VTTENSRGQARRELILAAGVRVVARAGAGAVTHRSVAAEAGVSLASTTYHFRGIDDLRRATFETAADEIGVEFDAALTRARSAMDPWRAASTRWSAVLQEHRPAFVAVLEMLVAATHDDALAGVAQELYRRAAASLASEGFDAPEALAAELIGLALADLVQRGRGGSRFGAQAPELVRRHASGGEVGAEAGSG
jgi:TetR/AcrR family transcriptional regulator, regulator of biofilm formation and stress response